MTANPVAAPKVDRRLVERQERFLSHAVVDVCKYRYLPVFVQSAMLLDISVGGFKLEFFSENMVSSGNQFWLKIPLSPLGVYAPKTLISRCECRWYDAQRMRMGGAFFETTKTQQIILEQVVEGLKDRKDL